MIHGLGGMGKTVLAARLAPRLDGVKAIRMTPTTTAQGVLDLLGAFLSVANARLNQPLIPQFAQLRNEPLPLETKATALIELLRTLRLLLIFDNYEDVLPEGQVVSRVGHVDGILSNLSYDPDLPKLIALLVEGVPGPSRLLFTSRVDFHPLEPGRLSGAIGHLDLGEMQFRDAVYLMETLPPLDRLPVAVLPEVRPDLSPGPSGSPGPPGPPNLGGTGGRAGPGETDSPGPPGPPNLGGTGGGEGPGERALSLRDLYTRLGGHPYTLALFAEHARRSSPDAVLADLAGVHQELLDFTLLDRAAGKLPDRARALLHRAAIYEEPVPVEGLAFLLGDDQDAMPPVEAEVQALLGWGLLARPPGSAEYAVHTLVRDWARPALGAEEKLALLRRAARFWLGTRRDSRDLGDYLRARHYLFQAGDYEQADDIVQFAWDYLLRWGQIELLLRLLSESVRTLSGNSRAVALGNLATVYQGLGEYTAARKTYEQVLAEFQASGAPHQVAAVLHQLGTLHQDQGEYGRARERYERSLAIAEELGDRAGVAISLAQMGLLFEAEDEFAPAVAVLAQALALFEQLGAPERDQARRVLTRLREKMGARAFEAALAQAGTLTPALSQREREPEVGRVPEAGEATESQGLMLEQAVQVVVQNTIAVLTQVPEKRAEWWRALGQLQGQVRAQGLAELAVFLGLLRRLVEGARPEGLAREVPEAFREAWEQVVRGTS